MRDLLPRRTLNLAALGTALAGAAHIPRPARAADRTLRVGFQKYGTLIILKQRGTLERALRPLGWNVSWHEFAFGPPLLEAINADALDFGTTGETPPVFAQAARSGIVYVGVEPPAPAGEGIVVPANSPITDLAGLHGRQIAVARGSNAHYLLFRALQSVGLSIRDVTPAYLAPADALAALRGGQIQAWSIWDPYLAAAQANDNVRLLKDGTGLVDNHQFFLAGRRFAQENAQVIRVLLREIDELDRWAAANIPEVAQALSPQTGIPVPVIDTALRRLTYGVRPITPEIVAAQQRIADTLHQAGLLPSAPRVQDAVWAG